MSDRFAPDDAIWVCGACGKTATNRYGIVGPHTHGWDESCMLNAVLCDRGDIVPGQRVPSAKAESESAVEFAIAFLEQQGYIVAKPDDEATVEKMAIALYVRRWGPSGDEEWPHEHENTRRMWRGDARAALRAARRD